MMRDFSRRNLFQMFGGAAVLLNPIISLREAKAQTAAKKRFVCFLSCAGVIQEAFWPNGSGKDFNLMGRTTEPLQPYKADLNFVRGLVLHNSLGEVDSHNGGAIATLTGNLTNKAESENADFSKFRGNRAALSPSIDQLIAEKYKGEKLAARSLELAVFPQGDRPSRFISYGMDGMTLPQMTDPYTVFDTIFKSVTSCAPGSPKTEEELKLFRLRRQSILDVLKNDLKDATRVYGLNGDEKAKLDAFATGIREIENRLSLMQIGTQSCQQLERFLVEEDRIAVDPNNYAQIARLHIDLIIAAFQLDITRVATLVWDIGGNSGVPSTWLNFNGQMIKEDYHSLTHRSGDTVTYREKLEIIDRWHASEFAHLIGRLKESKEGDSTILDQSLALWTSEMGNGYEHNAMNLPVVVAGRAGGAVEGGRFIDIPFHPSTNYGSRSFDASNKNQRLLLSILKAMDVQDKNELGNSGPVSHIL